MQNHLIGAEKHSVLPPTLFEKDGRFLEGVRTYILTETEEVGCAEQGPSEECYVIYKYLTTHKNILTIEQEYKAFIARFKNGQRNVNFFFHGRLKALESEPTTLLYYRKRATELEDKMKAIQKNSAKIKNVILKIHNVRKVPSETFGTLEKTAHPLKLIPAASCLKGRNLLLLKYFELINSSTAAGHLTNSAITLEAIKRALSEKQLTLVTHWVKQQRLSFSEAVGDIIYDYGEAEPSNESKCLALAQVAYVLMVMFLHTFVEKASEVNTNS
ncbi:LOW QUALITY PROTEIN: clathrin heavy chain linker domain-containing protein 1 [Pluvialis apricaria]